MRRDHMPVGPQIIEEASHWFVTMRAPSALADEREAFGDWLRASPLHVRAYLEVAALWRDAARVRPDHEADPDACTDSTVRTANLVQLPTGASRVSPVVDRHEPKGSRRRLSLAASVLVAGVLAGGIVWWRAAIPPTYVADVGEQRTFTLEDGSIVVLNSRSKISVRFSAQRRDIDLIDGQGLFDVAKNPSRPFIVHSGDVTVRAIGTAFDVYRRSSGTVVTVVEGQVLVDAERTSDDSGAVPSIPSTSAMPADVPRRMRLVAGEQATVTPTGVIERRSDPNVAAATRWLRQELVFTGETLGAVVEEFNRYTRKKIVLEDEALADERINAVFHSRNPDSLLRFVGRLDGVDVRESEGEIRISRSISRRGPEQ